MRSNLSSFPLAFVLAAAIFLTSCGGEKPAAGGENTTSSSALEKKIDKYQSGKTQEEYEFDAKRKLRHGKSVFYYEDGKPMIEQTYKDGKREGLQKKFYPDGKLEAEIEHKNDMMEGAFVFYYPDGKKKYEGTHKNNGLHGQVRSYYPSGTLKELVTMVDGFENGAFEEYYDTTGTIKTKGTYTSLPEEEGRAAEQGLLEEYNPAGEVIAKKDCDKGVCYTIWTKEKGDIKPKKIK